MVRHLGTFDEERSLAFAYAISGVGEQLGRWWLTRPDIPARRSSPTTATSSPPAWTFDERTAATEARFRTGDDQCRPTLVARTG